MENVLEINRSRKQAGIIIPMSNKTDYKLKLIRWDKEGTFHPIQGEEHITILNIYTANSGVPNFIKKYYKI